MISLRFVKRPGAAFLRQIIALYSSQGWWDKGDKTALASALVRNSHCFLIALDKDRVVGMGRALSDGVSDAYLQDIAVLKEYRGQGLGSTIVRSLKERLKADGIKWVGLIAQDGSRAFYENLGFKVIKRGRPMMLKDNHV
jgi:spermidine synthase